MVFGCVGFANFISGNSQDSNRRTCVTRRKSCDLGSFPPSRASGQEPGEGPATLWRSRKKHAASAPLTTPDARGNEAGVTPFRRRALLAAHGGKR
jgi:hypothetical protein